MRWRIDLAPVAGLLMAALAMGCNATAAPDRAPSSGEVRPEMLTGNAALAFGPGGRFRDPRPFLVAGQLTLPTAREQSLQFAKYATNNVILRGIIEAERGGTWIDPHLLVLCPQSYFVNPQVHSSSLDSLDSSRLLPLQHQFGPAWLIPLCTSAGVPEMVVQVAVNENAVVFRNNAPSDVLGRQFVGSGVPPGLKDPLLVSAERAVRFVWDSLHVRIAEAPELVARGTAYSNAAYNLLGPSHRGCNRWRITLERPVTLSGAISRTTRSFREVYVGSRTCGPLDIEPRLEIPLTIQPSGVYLVPVGGDPFSGLPVEFVEPVYLEETAAPVMG